MTLKQQIQSDLTAAMKAKDELTRSSLRMVLTAIGNEEVAGKASRELTDDEVLKVIAREAKKRREAAEAFHAGEAFEREARERAEGEVLERYLPTPLTEDELSALVAEAVSEAAAAGASGPSAMGQVMKIVQPKVAGRADGKRVSTAVRQALQG